MVPPQTGIFSIIIFHFPSAPLAASESLPAGSKAQLAPSETIPAPFEVLPAPSKALPVLKEALPSPPGGPKSFFYAETLEAISAASTEAVSSKAPMKPS